MDLFALYQNMNGFLSIIVLIALWDLVWKAIAMWSAAKRESKVWFVVLLFFNTAGVLPILYIVITKFFLKEQKGQVQLKESKESKKSKDKEETEAKSSSKKKVVKKKSIEKKSKKANKQKIDQTVDVEEAKEVEENN